MWKTIKQIIAEHQEVILIIVGALGVVLSFFDLRYEQDAWSIAPSIHPCLYTFIPFVVILMVGVLIIMKTKLARHPMPQRNDNTEELKIIANSTNCEISKTYDLFLASPMAAFSDSEYEEDRKRVLGLIDVIKATCQFSEVFYAGSSLLQQGHFEDEGISLKENLKKIEQSERFAMLYPSSLPSSVLVEAGYALAQKIPSIYIVHEGVKLPFLLRKAAEILPYVRSYEYKNRDHLINLIRHHSYELFPMKE